MILKIISVVKGTARIDSFNINTNSYDHFEYPYLHLKFELNGEEHELRISRKEVIPNFDKNEHLFFEKFAFSFPASMNKDPQELYFYIPWLDQIINEFPETRLALLFL
jgi:hypothetical protein